MGNFIRRAITNILDIPQDIIIQVLGRGFWLNRDKEPLVLEPDLGGELEFDPNGKIVIDRTPHHPSCTTHTRVADVNLEFNGTALVLTKTMVDYRIFRSRHEHIIDIIDGQPRTEIEEIPIRDICYTACVDKPLHLHTKKAPNFYK